MGRYGCAHGARGAIDFDGGPDTCVFQEGLDVAQYEWRIHGESSPVELPKSYPI